MKKVEFKSVEKPDEAVDTLEQIASEWIAQQRRKRFETTKAAVCEKQISNSFSMFYILKMFINTMNKKRRLGDVLYSLCLYIYLIAKFFIKFFMKKIKNAFVSLIEFILKVEKL